MHTLDMPLTHLVGVPYVACGREQDGADCWGIVRLAARELYGLDMPDYFYTEATILEHACAHIGREIRGPHWLLVGTPYPLGAVHLFRIKGFVTHCGLNVGGGDFLHSLGGRNSCIERLADWRERCTGTYQWTP
jgi:cell wall-associated NlpC family hydrolase